MIRFHSAYPWHTGGAYRQFMNDDDAMILPWILKFNKYDLYTKNENGLGGKSVEELWQYYETLIKKYFPCEELRW
jgi:inositol oxygenase